MNRRRSARLSRRVEVQFWQTGHAAHHGYSTNISATGMHIATVDPLPPRARLRIEVMHGDRGFLIEGVVAHRRAVHAELARVTPQGMGVRFLSPEELLREIFPAGNGPLASAGTLYPESDPLPYAAPHPGAAAPPSASPLPGAPAADVFDRLAAPVAASTSGRWRPEPPRQATSVSDTSPGAAPPAHSVAAVPPPLVVGAPRAAEAPETPDAGARAFSLRFATAHDFLGVYARDLVNGGLFVATSQPGRLREVVSIDIYPPDPTLAPVRLAARVVRRFQPAADGIAGPTGMGVELLDPADALARLRPLVSRFSSPVV